MQQELIWRDAYTELTPDYQYTLPLIPPKKPRTRRTTAQAKRETLEHARRTGRKPPKSVASISHWVAVDPVFAAALKAIDPTWVPVVPEYETRIGATFLARTVQAKNRYIARCKNGEPAPSPHDSSFRRYMQRDKAFATAIRTINPTWSDWQKNKQAFVPPSPVQVLPRLARLLELAASPETIARIIAAMSPEEAFALLDACTVTDQDILDRLINRALDL